MTLGTFTIIAGIEVSRLVVMGLCLGIGFYLSKKLTNKLDEYLYLSDSNLMEEVKAGI